MKRLHVRLIAILIAALMGAAGIAFMASASHLDVGDPDDTRGRLDVQTVQTGGAKRPRWRIITFSSWSSRDLWDTGFVTVLLDTRKRIRPDYYILIGSKGTHMYAHLWRDRATKGDFKVSKVKVWRPDRSSVSVKVPLRKMLIGNRRTFYRWSVETLFTGPRCIRVCFDFVPNEGAVVEPLPAPSPTVTITPTPTPTPTPTD